MWSVLCIEFNGFESKREVTLVQKWLVKYLCKYKYKVPPQLEKCKQNPQQLLRGFPGKADHINARDLILGFAFQGGL